MSCDAADWAAAGNDAGMWMGAAAAAADAAVLWGRKAEAVEVEVGVVVKGEEVNGADGAVKRRGGGLGVSAMRSARRSLAQEEVGELDGA
jgi:hypothetical protein